MIVTVLSQIYKCGCNRGIAKIEKPSLLPKLNSIIEWDLCEFPTKLEKKVEKETDEEGKEVEVEKQVEVEDRNFLGDEPELKPGNCFLFKGQVIAVDSVDSLVLVVSETGYGALDRLWEENIKTEIDLMFNNYDTDVIWKAVEGEDQEKIDKEYNQIYKVPYNLYKIWKDRFVEGRGFLKTGLMIEVKMESENYIFPINLVFEDWTVRYKEIELEEDEVGYAVKECISWFYNKYKRIVPKKEEKKEN